MYLMIAKPRNFSQLRKMCDDVSFGMAVQATRADSTSKRYRKSVYAAARIEKVRYSHHLIYELYVPALEFIPDIMIP